MKSIRLQLLVTLLATAVGVGLLVHRGPPPKTGSVGAAKEGNIQAVRSSVRWGVDVNTDRGPVLHGATTKDAATLLIAEGADINARDSDGATPLHVAARYGYRDVVELLIARGADIHARDHNGSTPLHQAASCGNKNGVELLIAKGADVNAEDYSGGTPLHDAVVVSRIGMLINPSCTKMRDMVELLIAKGADINAEDNDGHTPLQTAVRLRSAKVADILCKHGAGK